MRDRGIAYRTISNDKRSLKAAFYTAIQDDCIRKKLTSKHRRIALFQRYQCICKHIARLSSGSLLNAKCDFCCPVFFLTLCAAEASKYFRIGENKLRKLAEENPTSGWVIMNGNRIQIKRKQFEKIIDTLDVI